MAWVVDTCIVIDVLDNDPSFGRQSANLLDQVYENGLVLCPVSYVELAPAFMGDTEKQDYFLSSVGITFHEQWTQHDTRNAHKAWSSYVELRRFHRMAKRPIADILIGAYASRFDGLLTRNASEFCSVFPELPLQSGR